MSHPIPLTDSTLGNPFRGKCDFYRTERSEQWRAWGRGVGTSLSTRSCRLGLSCACGLAHTGSPGSTVPRGVRGEGRTAAAAVVQRYISSHELCAVFVLPKCCGKKPRQITGVFIDNTTEENWIAHLKREWL